MTRTILFISAIVAAGCFSSPTGPDAVAGRPFELRAGATATLSDGLTIKFDSVRSDSRCPMDVFCVRAGEAIIAVSVAAPRGNPESREMRTDATGSQTSYADHTIQLTALAPYPQSGRQISAADYIATFVVTTP